MVLNSTKKGTKSYLKYLFFKSKQFVIFYQILGKMNIYCQIKTTDFGLNVYYLAAFVRFTQHLSHLKVSKKYIFLHLILKVLKLYFWKLSNCKFHVCMI